MGILAKKQPALVGVDISSTSVKLVQLSRVSGGYRVEHYAIEPLSAGAVVERNIADADAVADAIQKAMSRSGSKAKLAAAAVSGSSVITKIIAMPAELDEDDMESQIQLEAGDYIPYPLEEVSLDFEVLGTTPGNDESVQVLLAASRFENVDLRVSALEAAGLEAKVVDVELFAIENAFQLMSDMVPVAADGLVALVDVGHTLTVLNVLRNGRSIYSREQTFGGKQLVDEIALRYGLSVDEAIAARRQGGLPDTYESEVLAPFLEVLAQQVGRLLQFFYAGTEFNRVDAVVVAGGTATLPGLPAMIEAQLGVPAVVANPMAHMSAGARVRAHALAMDAPALMVATGLALRGFD